VLKFASIRRMYCLAFGQRLMPGVQATSCVFLCASTAIQREARFLNSCIRCLGVQGQDLIVETAKVQVRFTETRWF